MYAELAIRNIRRNIRDYAIYFVTLVFAVAVFYVFNSLVDQPVITDMSGSQSRMVQVLLQVMSLVSIFMSVVVGMLILYANSFIVRRRKRELGTYILLGMSQYRVSLMMLVENLIIGAVALVAGIGIGVLLSQFFALVVAQVFFTTIQDMSFVLSLSAALRTGGFYALAFVVVGILGSVSVAKFKLIELIAGQQRNEALHIKGPSLQKLVLVISLGLIGWGYHSALILRERLVVHPTDYNLWLAALFCSMGTLGLLYSLGGMGFSLVSRFKKLYFKGLNSFVIRQTTGKINTNIKLLAMIAIMLSITLCSLGAGIGIRDRVMAEFDHLAPYDVMIWGGTKFELATGRPDFTPIYQVLKGSNALVTEVHTRNSGMGVDMLLKVFDGEDWNNPEYLGPRWYVGLGSYDSEIGVIPLSVFNTLRETRGYPPVSLESGQYLVYRQIYGEMLDYGLEQWMLEDVPINLAGRELHPATNSRISDPVGEWTITGLTHTAFVVTDEIAEQLPVMQSNMVISFPGTYDGYYDDDLSTAAVAAYAGNRMGFSSAHEVWFSQIITSAIVIFAGFYIGVIFLMASATVLALQQLAEAVENRRNYLMLSNLGSDAPSLSKALFKQLGLYFLIPAVIAVAHASVALYSVDFMYMETGRESMLNGMVLTSVLFLIVYGLYFILTYSGYKKILGLGR